MALLESQDNQNGRELQLIRQLLIKEIQNHYTGETRLARIQQELALTRMNTLLAVTKREFFHKEIMLSEFAMESLAGLLRSSILEDLTKKKYKAKLHEWVDAYPVLERAADQQLQAILAAEPQGLIGELRDSDQPDICVWGDDLDLRCLLGSELTNPEDVKSDGTYILPPVSIVAGFYSSLEEKLNPHLALQHHIDTVCENNADHDVRILVPVNAGQLHWMLVQADIRHGEVQDVKLIDSMSGSETALANVKNAVSGKEVEMVARNVQRDGFTCMDHSVQSALQAKYADAAEIADEHLRRLHGAKGVKKLRGAVVDAIIDHHPEIDAHSDKLLTNSIKTAVQSDLDLAQVDRDLVEQELHAILTCHAGQTISEIVAKNSQQFQIQFDAVLARKLGELYEDCANAEKDDAELFHNARVHAFNTMRYGFFQPRELKTEGQTSTVPRKSF